MNGFGGGMSGMGGFGAGRGGFGRGLGGTIRPPSAPKLGLGRGFGKMGPGLSGTGSIPRMDRGLVPGLKSGGSTGFGRSMGMAKVNAPRTMGMAMPRSKGQSQLFGKKKASGAAGGSLRKLSKAGAGKVGGMKTLFGSRLIGGGR